jgi:imidazolonepropionase-like amidohydrolase
MFLCSTRWRLEADTTGTIEAGKDADILAVAGNPLEDITAIHDVIAAT